METLLSALTRAELHLIEIKSRLASIKRIPVWLKHDLDEIINEGASVIKKIRYPSMYESDILSRLKKFVERSVQVTKKLEDETNVLQCEGFYFQIQLLSKIINDHFEIEYLNPKNILNEKAKRSLELGSDKDPSDSN